MPRVQCLGETQTKANTKWNEKEICNNRARENDKERERERENKCVSVVADIRIVLCIDFDYYYYNYNCVLLIEREKGEEKVQTRIRLPKRNMYIDFID